MDMAIASLNKTSNYMETFNRKFSSMICPMEPNNFLNTLYMEQQPTDELMLQERVDDPPPTAKKWYTLKTAESLLWKRTYAWRTSHSFEYLESRV